jgi:hypothetical protein
MSFGSWNLFEGGIGSGSGSITPHVSSPIADFQSLEISLTTSAPTADRQGNVTRKDESALLKGITNGRMHTLMRRDSGTGLPQEFAGIVAMQSQEDMTVSGSAYTVGVGGDDSITLRRTTSGVNSGTVLATGDTIVFTIGTVIALELMWFFDIPEFGGTRLQVFAGSTLGTMTLRYDIIDPIGTALTTSVAEGLFATLDTGNSPSKRWVYDTTELYEVSLI